MIELIVLRNNAIYYHFDHTSFFRPDAMCNFQATALE